MEGVDYSGTNVQVVGVDEPDIIKTDGTRILTVVDGKLSYVDVTTGDPLLLGTLQLTGGWNHQLLVVGETVFVFANGGGGVAIPTDVAAIGGFFYPGLPGQLDHGAGGRHQRPGQHEGRSAPSRLRAST